MLLDERGDIINHTSAVSMCNQFRKERAERRAALAHRQKLTDKALPKLRKQFRRYVRGLAPGTRITWREIDAWVMARAPYPFEPHNMIEGDPWADDLNVACIVIVDDMACKGWLSGDLDDETDYVRTPKAE